MKRWHKFFITVVVILAVMIIVFFNPVLCLPLFELVGWFDILTESPSSYTTMALIAGILLLLFVSAFWLLPFLCYIAKKIYIYISLWFTCLSKKHKFKITRVPFASLRRFSAKGDIRITTDEGVINLHFLDLVFVTRKSLTILNDTSYAITKTTRGNATQMAKGFVGTSRPVGKRIVVHSEHQELVGTTDKIKHIAHIEKKSGEIHILIMQTVPVESRVVIDGIARPLASGQSFGTLKFCSLRMLKQSLKGKLHTSIFDEFRN